MGENMYQIMPLGFRKTIVRHNFVAMSYGPAFMSNQHYFVSYLLHFFFSHLTHDLELRVGKQSGIYWGLPSLAWK